MANLINATVYQIDGNPQSVATVVAFDTDKIRLQETTLSTISEVVSFIEVQGEKLNAPVVKYFVSESVATLVAAANTGGVTLLQATIVAINDNPFKTSLQIAFPANKVTVWAFSNGTIQSFLQFNEDKFYATESKSTLITAANSAKIIISGNTPTIVASVPASVTVSIVGNDTSGTITVVNTASIAANTGGFMVLTFSSPYPSTPRIFFQAANSAGANFANRLYLTTGTTGTNLFIDTASAIAANTYKFSYLVVG